MFDLDLNTIINLVFATGIIVFTIMFVNWLINDFLGSVVHGIIDFIKNLFGGKGG